MFIMCHLYCGTCVLVDTDDEPNMIKQNEAGLCPLSISVLSHCAINQWMQQTLKHTCIPAKVDACIVWLTFKLKCPAKHIQCTMNAHGANS